MTVHDEDPDRDAAAGDHPAPGQARLRRPLLLGAAAVAAVVVAAGVAVATNGSSGEAPSGAAGTVPAAGSASATAAGSGGSAAPGGTGAPAPTATTGAGTPTGRPPPSGPGAPVATGLGASPTSVDDPAARAAACSLRSESISSLVNPPAGEPRGAPADLLRDAVPTLNANLAGWTDAARGRPELAAAVAVVAKVEMHWTAALRAYDSGDERAGQQQTRAAEAEVARLDPLVAAARQALGARC